MGQAEGAAAARLHATTMKHLHEVESLILDIERLLHCADVQCGGADTKTASTTSKTDILMSLEDVTEALEGGRPTFAGFERSRTGYVLCVDLGTTVPSAMERRLFSRCTSERRSSVRLLLY